jgi:hypothetical protein
VGFLRYERGQDGYQIRKRIDLFKNEKDNYLFCAFFKADKYYISYMS